MMDADYYKSNRERLYKQMSGGSLLVIFSGVEIIKTNDEYYPFFAERNFVYLTGLECKEAILFAIKDGTGAVEERLYILPPDRFAERWTGVRIKAHEAEAVSGISDIRSTELFEEDFRKAALSGNYGSLYLDLYKIREKEIDRPAHELLRYVQSEMSELTIERADEITKDLRLYKRPCEIEALRTAELITRDGIVAMMKASRPGMYEYQYKAEFDYALGQYKPYAYGFPPIVSAGRNNFIIHYYSYTGQAQDGDMILNDVGVNWDHMISDVSRGWPCNGRFNDKQRLLYEIALATNDYLFEIVKPGMRMEDVDKTTHSYCAQLLKDAGVLDDVKNINKYMWHNGAHHIGYDVHDVVRTPEFVEPNMAFCIDTGIYHEEWGIGFRIEDDCLVTVDGCENLSAVIPRTIEEIESIMN